MANSPIEMPTPQRVHLLSTLAGDVLSVVKNAEYGITFYSNSNTPTNQPPGCSWGSYTIFKIPVGTSDFRASVLYFDGKHIAFIYTISSASSGMTWTVL